MPALRCSELGCLLTAWVVPHLSVSRQVRAIMNSALSRSPAPPPDGRRPVVREVVEFSCRPGPHGPAESIINKGVAIRSRRTLHEAVKSARAPVSGPRLPRRRDGSSARAGQALLLVMPSPFASGLQFPGRQVSCPPSGLARSQSEIAPIFLTGMPARF